MPTFKNLNDLTRFLQKKIEKKIQTSKEIRQATIEALQSSIDENVYDVYEPRVYERQREHGGLTDPQNFHFEHIDMGIAVFSIRKGKSRKNRIVYVSEIVEGFEPYSIPDIWGYGYEAPRHFVAPAAEELRQTGVLTEILRRELEKDGFKFSSINVKIKH